MNAKRILTTAALLAGVATAASAQTATQVVTFQVDAINQIAFAGSPSLVINTATAGSNPTSATAAGTWAVTTNQLNQKITASIGAAMPAGLTLSVMLTAPAGSTSFGGTLSTTAVDLVTGIAQLAQNGLAVNYTLSATPAAGVVASTTRTVTYTITNGT
jgi:opacity protein-like surface antigen